MKMLNLNNIMISISEAKKQFSEMVNKGMTKVIIKNNEPVSVVLPYNDYLAMTEQIEEGKTLLKGIGQDITLNNGTQVMVCVSTNDKDSLSSDGISIKIYLKMKTSGDYKLHYTLHLGAPNVDETLTSEELVRSYMGE